MKLSKIIFVLFLLISLVTGIIFFPAKTGYAVGNDSVGISPHVVEITTKKGESFEKVFTITNRTQQKVRIITEVQDLVKEGQVWLESKETNPQIAPMTWGEVVDSPEYLDPNKSAKIKVAFKVPQDASIGEHRTYLRVKFQPEEKQGVTVASELVPIFYIKVADQFGNMNLHEGYQFTAKTSWLNLANPTFSVSVHNTGNTHVPIRGKVEVYDVLRNNRTEIPIPLYRILPDEIRDSFVIWDQAPVIGYFQATVSVTMDEQTYQQKQLNFIIIPKTFSIGLVLFIISIFPLFRMYKKRVERKIKRKIKHDNRTEQLQALLEEIQK